jgi:hypothetical protein
MPDDRVAVSLYEQDFDAWAETQAASLRAAGNGVANAGERPDELLRTLDWDNLAEEIEALARQDRRELASRMALIIEHLVKLEFSSYVALRAGWIETVLREREEIEELLQESPSLRQAIPDLLAHRSVPAIHRAVRALAHHGERNAAVVARLKAGYQPDEVLGHWLPDETSHAGG